MKLKTVALFVTLLLLVPLAARADLGPKPTMSFYFNDETGKSLSVVSGQLIECEDAQCKKSAPLGEMGPQRFECNTNQKNSCFAMAYSFAPYHKLSVIFSDNKTRESNIFAGGAFDARFNVQVNNSSLVIGETTLFLWKGRMAGFLPSLIVTILAELITAFFIFTFLKTPTGQARPAWWLIIVVNLITVPIVWFIFPLLQGALLIVVASELFAIIAEIYLLFYLNRKRYPLRRLVWISIAMNIISFLGGTVFMVLFFPQYLAW